jgi:DNA-binding NarL/FixJ family response regulator
VLAADGFAATDIRADSVAVADSATGSVAENIGRDAFKVVVATSRPTIRAFFEAMGREAAFQILVTCMPLSAAAAAAEAKAIGSAQVAVVDASLDSVEAINVCVQALAIKAELEIIALFCCPRSATAAQVRALASVGVRSFVEEGQLSEAEVLRVIQTVARGQGVLRLQIAEAQTLFTGAGVAVPSDFSSDDLQVLEQVVLGLTDPEIGRQLYLSRHTVKHRIERLRRRAGARNRVQLAVWATRLFDTKGS